MKAETISLKDTGYFSDILLDYIGQSESLSGFYNLYPSPENFKEAIDNRNFDPIKRENLVGALKQQYHGYSMNKGTEKSLGLLSKDNTFTITTGHQLNIFTGPLYFIYKIVTTINTAKKLKEAYPEYNFVPVYWMASEDHDFDEIRSFHLFGKTYSWKTDVKGAVGRLNPSGIKEILEVLPEKLPLFESAYLNNKTLAQATREIVHGLFPNSDLIIIDADDQILKGQFKEVIKDDLVNHRANDLVEEASSKLADLGHKSQVYPRSINLFYLEDNLRGRIVKEEGKYSVLGITDSFSEDEIIKMVEDHPERFSQNVILRPLYQEMILPNLAYIGGPAEVSYWLQLKEVFDHYKVPFPVIMPRNFALVLNQPVLKKLQKLGLRKESLFLDLTKLKKKYIEEHTQFIIDLKKEKDILDQLFESIHNKSMAVDKSLGGFVAAERAKTMKSIENIEKRLIKSEEQNQETGLRQVENLKERLFPSGMLQERHDNLLTFYLNNPTFIEEISKVLDPFNFNFYLLSDS